MSNYTFTPAEVPEVTVGRTIEPNPYLDQVKELAGHTDDDGRSVVAATVQVPNEDVDKVIRKVQAAGREVNVSVRKKVTPADAKSSMLTIWTTPKITRPRKGQDADAGK